MKILVKVLKVEDNTVHYAEINQKDGKVMIEDYMSVESFQKALESDFQGFKLVECTKQQAIKIIKMFGLGVTNWEYHGSVKTFEVTIKLNYEYDNGYGYMIDEIGVAGYSQNAIVEQAICAKRM